MRIAVEKSLNRQRTIIIISIHTSSIFSGAERSVDVEVEQNVLSAGLISLCPIRKPQGSIEFPPILDGTPLRAPAC